MSVSWSEALAYAAMITRNLQGDHLTNVPGDVPVYVGVWPVTQSGGKRAATAWIRPDTDVHVAVDVAANTAGYGSAKLLADQMYIFTLAPQTNTLSFLGAAGATAGVEVVWVLP